MFGAIGCLGRVPFICSHGKVLTFSKLSRERKIRWARHEVIGQKPVLEWIGEDLNTVSMTVRLDVSLGVLPHVALKFLESMMASKEPHILLIGGEMLGRYVIASVHEDRKFHTGLGICQVAEVTLSLIEFSGEVDDWYSKASDAIGGLL